MVQTDIAQYSTECTDWLTNLRRYREEFQQCQKQLQQTDTHSLNKDQLKEVDHFYNQFEIQLTNIHHLKQAIKAYGRTVLDASRDVLEEDNVAYHEDLFDQYTVLENNLHELRHNFNQFISQLR
jgi:hypothetical protein